MKARKGERTKQRFYEFDQFQVHPIDRLLLHNGKTVSLPSKSFDLLAVLVQNSGRLLDKDFLLAHVWLDAVVEENSIAKAISDIRKALGESSREQRYIATIAKHGYKFLPKVTIRVAPASVRISELSTGPSTIEVRIAGERVTSLAVLPFTHLISTANDTPLGVGLADALISRLSNLPQIVVRPTASILKYSGDHRDPISIATELGVEFVISGSLQLVGDRVRLTVQMVTPDQKRCVWADSFEERFTHIFSVEDSISSRVATALSLKLTNAQRESLARQHTANSEAYQAYLHGRYFWSNQTFASALHSIEYFRRAIALDPHYAFAWAGIADAYILIGLSGALTGGLPPNQVYPEAKKAALRSIELYEAQAEAHTSLGFTKFFYDWDETAALEEFDRALSLQPYYASAHHGRALIHGFMGRRDESIASIETALEIEPLSPIMNANKGYLLYIGRRYSESVAQLQKTLELDTAFAATHYRLALALCGQQKYDEAIRELKEAQHLSEESPHVVGTLAYIYGVTGRNDLAGKILRQLITASRTRHVSSTIPAEVLVGMGSYDDSLSWLRRAIEERVPAIMTLRVDPRFDQFRSMSPIGNMLQTLFTTEPLHD